LEFCNIFLSLVKSNCSNVKSNQTIIVANHTSKRHVKMYKRIITHADFDGVVCATICSHVFNIDFIVFTQPRLVNEAKIAITKEDIVCDLPFPLECGMWFDHHEGNLEELKYRNIDIESINGKFEAAPSCARVIYNYFSSMDLPDHFEPIVEETDIIDSFDYKDIEDWRRKTPGKTIEATIKLKEPSAQRKWAHLRNLVQNLKTRPIEEVSKMPSVRKRYRQYLDEEERMLEQIKKEIAFLPEDTEHRLIILDMTHYKHQPNVLKHLAYLVHPEAQAVLQISNLFSNHTKTNDLSFSMSLSLNLKTEEHSKDVGDIMRILNLGGGHPGAGAGVKHCSGKEEMVKTKDEIIHQIFKLFENQ